VTLDDIVRRLRTSLESPLPGADAHLRMVRRPPRGFVPGVLPADCRDGAVLLLVYESDGEPRIVLTLRSDSLSRHRAQVSLPGGAMEEGETERDAAIREAVEEIGIEAGSIRVLGDLTPFHVPVSRFIIHPVLAYSERALTVRAASPEVERIIEAPVRLLLDPATVRIEPRVLDGLPYEVPYFDVAGLKVWGATAMILSEFVALLGVRLDPS